jgi:hypothetical protein
MSALTNLNYMKQILRHPCALPDPIIAVKTAFEAALPLLFVVTTFSCTDYVKAHAGISWKCGRKMKALAKATLGPKYVGHAAFWYQASGAALAEQALWFWFLAELGTGFVADWTTLIYQEQKCDLDNSGYIHTSLAIGFAGPGEIREVPPGGLDTTHCARFNGHGVFVEPGCSATISFAIEWESFRPDLFGYGSVRTWLEDDRGHKYGMEDSQPNQSPSKNVSFGGINSHPGKPVIGTFYRVMSEVLSGVMGVHNGDIHVTTQGRPMPLIPAGCFTPHDTANMRNIRLRGPAGPADFTPLGSPIRLPQRVGGNTQGKTGRVNAAKPPPARKRKPHRK